MPFREPEGVPVDNYGPEGEYLANVPRNPNMPRNRFPRGSRESDSCFGSMTCISEVLTKVKDWLFTLGKGYLYLIVAILVFAALPLFMVSKLIKSQDIKRKYKFNIF